MNRSLYLLLFLMGLVVILVVASFQNAPGYMDADYYYLGGFRLAQGYGFTEPILWNYLDEPTGIPHASHTYWMPLASILAAAGMKLTGNSGFDAARIGFLLLSACIPPLTAALSYSLTMRREAAIFAGLLALFPGFYLAFMATTDTFSISMVLGALLFLVAGPTLSQTAASLNHLSHVPLSGGRFFLLGSLAGLLHLSRADGILWLVVIFMIFLQSQQLNHTQPITAPVFGRFAFRVIACLCGYLLFLAPWMMRNYIQFGVLLSPGGGRTLWLTSYDELYLYPATLLTPARWLAAGLLSVLQARLWALGQNIQTVIAVQGQIFLLPLIFAGGWRLRSDARIRLGGLGWLLIFMAMTIVFPFAGVRGGLFHSGAAVQPLLWALAPVGLESFIKWGEMRRGWCFRQAQMILGVGFVGVALLLSAFITYDQLRDDGGKSPSWGQSQAAYRRVGEVMSYSRFSLEDVVMVNNPPGFYLGTNRPAIVIPDGDVSTTLAVAQQYQAKFLLLEANHPEGLAALYKRPDDMPGIRYLWSFEEMHLFQVEY